MAMVVMADRRASLALPLEAHQLADAIGVIVRVVLSHIMAPSDSPANAVEDITWRASQAAGRRGVRGVPSRLAAGAT